MAFGPVVKATESMQGGDLKGVAESWPFALLTSVLFLLGLVPVLILGPARPVLERLLTR